MLEVSLNLLKLKLIVTATNLLMSIYTPLVC